MKKCKCLGSVSDIVKWAPEHYYGKNVAKTDKDKLLHICTKCGHAHAVANHADAELRAETFKRQ